LRGVGFGHISACIIKTAMMSEKCSTFPVFHSYASSIIEAFALTVNFEARARKSDHVFGDQPAVENISVLVQSQAVIHQRNANNISSNLSN
jgi:hypothetical protein